MVHTTGNGRSLPHLLRCVQQEHAAAGGMPLLRLLCMCRVCVPLPAGLARGPALHEPALRKALDPGVSDAQPDQDVFAGRIPEAPRGRAIRARAWLHARYAAGDREGRTD